MGYTRWATKEEVVNRLEPVNLKTGVERSGIPIAYDDKYLYINNRDVHNVIIGSTGSGKTQSVILPIIRLSLLANDSILVNDPKGELYRKCANGFINNGYDTLVLDFDDTRYGLNWNPLKLPYDLYKNNNRDKAMMLVEDLAYYLFYENDKNIDPFWVNSVISYFTGIVLYLFENAKEEEINLSSIYNFSNYLNNDNVSKKFIEKLDTKSNIYSNLEGTLKAPTETRGSILSVFSQKIKYYISRENLANMLSYNDIDMLKIPSKPTAIFIVSGKTGYSNKLIPLFVSQTIESYDLYNGTCKRLNVLLDEFDSMTPIRDFYKSIEYCRSLNICITITLKSYIHLYNLYSKEDSEILLMCFGNIIYLLSDDIYTLEDISKRCGMQEVNGNVVPLVTVEDLKTIKQFEAIVLSSRNMPIKTKLLPDYQIDWGYDDTDAELKQRKIHDICYYSE